MSYEKYIKKDFFEYQQSYQFSKFEGYPFLESYKKTRLQIIKNLEINIKEQKNLTLRDFLKSKVYSARIKPNKNFRTNEILKNILMLLVLNKGHKKEIYNWLNKFIKKYEVSKRLYEVYDKEFRKLSNNYKNTENYVLLSLNSLLYYKISGNLKFLNTTLKLNDAITTILNKIKRHDLFLAYQAFAIELEEIKSLSEIKEITI